MLIGWDSWCLEIFQISHDYLYKFPLRIWNFVRCENASMWKAVEIFCWLGKKASNMASSTMSWILKNPNLNQEKLKLFSVFCHVCTSCYWLYIQPVVVGMTKGNKGKSKAVSSAKHKEQQERKRDARARRNALKKEREAREYLENDENFVSFSNQLQAVGYKIKDIKADGLELTLY